MTITTRQIADFIVGLILGVVLGCVLLVGVASAGEGQEQRIAEIDREGTWEAATAIIIALGGIIAAIVGASRYLNSLTRERKESMK